MDGTQSLLRWGIEHAAPGALPKLAEDMKAGRRPDLNTDMLKAIMGTSDADRMKECVEVIEGRWVDRDGGGVKDADVTKEDRLRAWDDLEMVSLRLAEELREELMCSVCSWWRTSTMRMVSLARASTEMEWRADESFGEHRSQVPEPLGTHIEVHDRRGRGDRSPSLLGLRYRGAGATSYSLAPFLQLTFLQNNPRAQSAVSILSLIQGATANPPPPQFLELDPLPTIISLLLSRTLSPAARNKAMYAISSTLKLSEPAVMRFAELDGWNVLHQTLLGASSPPYSTEHADLSLLLLPLALLSRDFLPLHQIPPPRSAPKPPSSSASSPPNPLPSRSSPPSARPSSPPSFSLSPLPPYRRVRTGTEKWTSITARRR